MSRDLDFFDPMCIEIQTALDTITGVDLYLKRYRPAVPEQHIYQIVRSIGYLDDVEDDPALPVSRDANVTYWTARQPQIEKVLSLRH